MTIEVTILLSVLSVAAALYFGLANVRRNRSKDTAEGAAQMTTVLVKLENIGNGITEIKTEMGNVKGELRELRDRLIVVEKSTESAHSRLDKFGGGRE